MIDILKDKTVQVGLLVVATGAASAGVSHILTKKSLETKYAQMAQEDINTMKQHYKLLYKADEKSPYSEGVDEEPEEDTDVVTMNEIVETLEYSTVQYDDISEKAVEVEVEETSTDEPWPFEKTNVFQHSSIYSQEDFDDEEVKKRTPDAPYIITKDEFMNNETSFQQITVTYFNGDDVLADDKDQMINDKERTVGEINLDKMGYGSDDPNVLYVRNDRMEVEFEILNSDGKYSEEVCGFIEHSDKPRLRKFRGEYE